MTFLGHGSAQADFRRSLESEALERAERFTSVAWKEPRRLDLDTVLQKSVFFNSLIQKISKAMSAPVYSKTFTGFFMFPYELNKSFRFPESGWMNSGTLGNACCIMKSSAHPYTFKDYSHHKQLPQF